MVFQVPFDVERLRELHKRLGTREGCPVAISSDGKRVSVADPSREATVWDVETGHELLRISTPSCSRIQAVRFSPNGEHAFWPTMRRA